MVLEGRLHAICRPSKGKRKFPFSLSIHETLQIFLLQFRQLGPAGKQPPYWGGKQYNAFRLPGPDQKLAEWLWQ